MEKELQTGTMILISKPKLSQELYELRTGDKVVGRIGFPKSFGTLAEAELFAESWTFKRMGFWKPCITVRLKSSDHDLMQIPFSGRKKGLLNFTGPEGETYILVKKSFWSSKWIWLKKDRILIEYSIKSGFKKFAEVVVLENDERLHLLLMIGAYGLIMHGMDEVATVVAT